MPASGSEKVTEGLRPEGLRVKDGDPPSWQLQVPSYKTGKLITLTTATWLMILVDQSTIYTFYLSDLLLLS